MQHALSHPLTRPRDQMTVLTKDMALGKYEARGVEQHLIEKLGMQKPTGATTKVGNLENKINSMSPKHEFYDQATAFGKDWVDQSRVSDSLCAGAWFTSNPRIGWGKTRLVG